MESKRLIELFGPFAAGVCDGAEQTIEENEFSKLSQWEVKGKEWPNVLCK